MRMEGGYTKKKIKYLNLGCGSTFSTMPEWTNIDFVSNSRDVIAHNLLNGIPFDANTFDLVYHSHVLEHFSRENGEQFIEECFRVLKPGGILRIAIPDLEQIVKQYLYWLEKGLESPENLEIMANYEWIKLEMYDQTVRNKTGGRMGAVLSQEAIINENFIYERIGEEGRQFRLNHFSNKKSNIKKNLNLSAIKKLLTKIKHKIINKLAGNNYYAIGHFRMQGEVHQWMYDSYSIAELMKKNGGMRIEKINAFESKIENWRVYNLDGVGNNTRKPDSLFMECIKS